MRCCPLDVTYKMSRMGEFIIVVICLVALGWMCRMLYLSILVRKQLIADKRNGVSRPRNNASPSNYAWMDQNQPLAQRRRPATAPRVTAAPDVSSENALPDETWLARGHERFERDKHAYFGSPETMHAGARDALARSDRAAALFFYAKAIDIAQTWSFGRPGERSPALDDTLFSGYVSLVCELLDSRPALNVLSGYNENGNTAGAYMASLARTPVQRQAADTFIARTGMQRP